VLDMTEGRMTVRPDINLKAMFFFAQRARRSGWQVTHLAVASIVLNTSAPHSVGPSPVMRTTGPVRRLSTR